MRVMQNGRAVCLNAPCVYGVCLLVPATLPCCGGCGSPVGWGGGTCACPGRGAFVVLPLRCPPPPPHLHPPRRRAPGWTFCLCCAKPLPLELVVWRPVLC